MSYFLITQQYFHVLVMNTISPASYFCIIMCSCYIDRKITCIYMIKSPPPIYIALSFVSLWMFEGFFCTIPPFLIDKTLFIVDILYIFITIFVTSSILYFVRIFCTYSVILSDRVKIKLWSTKLFIILKTLTNMY